MIETSALMGRLELLLLELLSINTCINTFASAGRAHGESARFKNGHARVETCVLKTLACRNGFWTSFIGNGPNTVSGSTVSNTELSEFFGAH